MRQMSFISLYDELGSANTSLTRCLTVRVAAMVQVPGQISSLKRVDIVFAVEAEMVVVPSVGMHSNYGG